MKIKIPILTIIQTKMLLTLVKNKSLIIFCQDINLHLKKIYSEIEKINLPILFQEVHKNFQPNLQILVTKID